MPDRGGGREPKGASLKVTKKNPGGVAARGMKKKVVLSPESKPNLPAPAPRSGNYFDCSTAILSRQFDRDRDRVLSRAASDGVSGMLCWFADIEKLDDLASLCAANSGLCYYIAGVHPDNIDRTNKKLHDGWMLKVDDFARNAECIALLSGLNFNREIGTHFAQESLLRASYKLAVSLGLPLVLHLLDPKSLERAVEVLLEEGYSNDHPIILHDFLTCARGDMSIVASTLQHDFFYSFSAHPLLFEAADVSPLSQIPISRYLLCSNAPWNTPQNIPDTYIRSQRNESSNISFVVDILYDMLVAPYQSELAKAAFTQQLHENAIHVFKLSADEVCKEEKVSCNVEEEKDVPAPSVEPTMVSQSHQETPATAAGSYACNKCRTALFSSEALMSHDMATVFNKGTEGTCNAVLYLSSEQDVPMFNIQNDVISCAKCQAKIGKYVPHEVQCPCGAMISGPLYRITTSKVDYNDLTAHTQELAQRSAEEMTTIFSAMELSAQEERERAMQLKQQKKSAKKKKLKSENKGNFSDYRNKSFIPNASRKAASGAANLAELSATAGEDSDSDDSV